MPQSQLADIARLMLKSHFELSRIPVQLSPGREAWVSTLTSPELLRALTQAPAFSPFEFKITTSPSTRVSCSVDPLGLMTLRASHGDRAYSARLPAEGDAEALQATLSLSDGKSYRELVISGKDFLSGVGVPSEFADLHRMVVSHAHRQLGLQATQGNSDHGARELTPASDAVVAQPTASVPAESAPEFRPYRIYRPQDKDLVFTGKCLASVSSPVVNGRAWSYSLFQTQGGKFIGVKQGHSSRLGEGDRIDTVVVDAMGDTQAFFGSGILAKLLYRQIGLDHVEIIE